MNVRVRNSLVVVGGLAVVFAVAGCGSSSGTPDGEASAPVEVQKVSISSGAAAAETAMDYYALEMGYFDEVGLDAEIHVAGGNVLTEIVGGTADIGLSGFVGALIPVTQGKDTSIIWGTSSAASLAYVSAIDGIDDITECTRITTGAAGTSSAVWTEIYKNELGLDAEIVNLADNPSQIALLASGQADCLVASPSVADPGIQSGDLHFIIETDDQSTVPSEVQPYMDAVGASVYVLTDTAQDKADMLTKYAQARMKAVLEMEETPAEDVADVLLQNPDWAGFEKATVVSLLEGVKPFLNPSRGNIDQDQWDVSLEFANYANPDIDPTDPKWSVEERFDPTFWENAER